MVLLLSFVCSKGGNNYPYIAASTSNICAYSPKTVFDFFGNFVRTKILHKPILDKFTNLPLIKIKAEAFSIFFFIRLRRKMLISTNLILFRISLSTTLLIHPLGLSLRKNSNRSQLFESLRKFTFLLTARYFCVLVLTANRLYNAMVFIMSYGCVSEIGTFAQIIFHYDVILRWLGPS